MTNYERIKNMSIEEMVQFLPYGRSCDDCAVPVKFCASLCRKICGDEDCEKENYKYLSCDYKINLWLNSEVENVKN